jgi:hypothetical protein
VPQEKKNKSFTRIEQVAILLRYLKNVRFDGELGQEISLQNSNESNKSEG